MRRVEECGFRVKRFLFVSGDPFNYLVSSFWFLVSKVTDPFLVGDFLRYFSPFYRYVFSSPPFFFPGGGQAQRDPKSPHHNGFLFSNRQIEAKSFKTCR